MGSMFSVCCQEDSAIITNRIANPEQTDPLLADINVVGLNFEIQDNLAATRSSETIAVIENVYQGNQQATFQKDPVAAKTEDFLAAISGQKATGNSWTILLEKIEELQKEKSHLESQLQQKADEKVSAEATVFLLQTESEKFKSQLDTTNTEKFLLEEKLQATELISSEFLGKLEKLNIEKIKSQEQWQQAIRTVEATQIALENLRAGSEATSVEKAVLDDHLQTEKLKTMSLSEQIKILKTEKISLEEKLQQAIGEKTSIGAALSSLSMESERLKTQLGVVNAEKPVLERKLKMAEASSSEFSKKLEILDAEKTEFQEQWQQTIRTMATTQAALENLRLDLEAASAEKAALDFHLRAEKLKSTDLSRQVETLRIEKTSLEGKLQQEIAQKTSAQFELSNFQERFLNMERELKILSEEKKRFEDSSPVKNYPPLKQAHQVLKQELQVTKQEVQIKTQQLNNPAIKRLLNLSK